MHGIHSLLWALDCLAQTSHCAQPIRSIKAQFLQPLYVGDQAYVEIAESPPHTVRARVMVASEEVLAASVSFAPNSAMLAPAVTTGDTMLAPLTPMTLDLESMSGFAGSLSFCRASSEIDDSFPSIVRVIGKERVYGLMACSRLVGMVVPGLHSLFSGLDVSFHNDGRDMTDALGFRVISVVPRFRLVRIAVSGPGLRGSLETVCRLPPVKQPSMIDVRSRVANGEFQDATALIIGGSRGLGELTAKLIAAGGGRVVLTYASGQADAQCVVSDIAGTGASCSAVPYDVRRPAAAQLAAIDARPTHVYYFATPPIFRRKDGLFDLERFTDFNLFYVTAFFELMQAAVALWPSGLSVFYPSSTAIEKRPASMTEYTMSKAAGEILCADMAKFVSGLRVLTHRLPRLPTDQTSSVMTASTVDPIAAVLPILRQMHQRR